MMKALGWVLTATMVAGEIGGGVARSADVVCDLDGRGLYDSPKVIYASKDGCAVPPYDSWANAATNIQSALNIADDGDLVLVGPGVWEPVTMDRAVVLRGSDGAEKTIIDGGWHRCGVTMNMGGVLEGFTVRNGYGSSNGGIFADRGAVVRNVTVEGNVADEYGGGIVAIYWSVVERCVLKNNRTKKSGGAGGGAWIGWGSRMLECVLEGNQTDGRGGGVYCENSEIAGCELIGNAARHGGGVFITSGTFHNNLVSGNTASESGGGMRISSGFGHDCLVVGNEARAGAGGVVTGGELWNFTVVSNKAIESAGGVRLEGGTLGNTIVWGNESMGEEKNVSAFSSRALNHCCWPEAEGEGHIAADPQFAGDGDYHLRAGSPCVDAGETQDWMFEAEDWFDGQQRVSPGEGDGGRVDIGADEAAVDAVGTPGAGKSSWTWRVVPDACLQLQRTTTLTPADWRDEGPSFTTTALEWCLDEPFAHPSPTFYRLLWLK